MGAVTAISLLIPGAQVYVSENIVKINMAGGIKYFDALAIEEVNYDTSQEHIFIPMLSVPEDAQRPVVLIQCDMQFEGDFTHRALKFIKQGAHYKTTLQGGLPIPGEEDETELICDFAYALDESETGAVLLGVLSADLDE